ncbi:hypothetical protein [Pseudomonas sp. C32]|uniref:hypothetical protein n=1 Tax=Pseudomonas sp. C32 TaxID=1529208 RepID=UPI0026207A61|nr:hypothetical protein [Pseudomonas sp. C32]MDN4543841.1 hypothetical protein [Pseudomonas sp. C32]
MRIVKALLLPLLLILTLIGVDRLHGPRPVSNDRPTTKGVDSDHQSSMGPVRKAF